MKKILLATSILAGTAGLAAADGHAGVALSGDARMGIIDNFGPASVVFTSRARVKFTMTGTTDGGLEFGASFRAADASGAGSGQKGEVYISGAFGRLAMGDVDGAANAAVGQVDGVGLTGLGDLNEMTFIAGGSKPSILYSYSAGAFTGYLSLGQLDDGVGAPTAETRSIAAKYSTDAFTVALGYEDNDAGTDHIILGAETTFSNVTLKARYGKASATGFDGDQYALSATYSADALSVTAFFANDEELGGDEGYGLGASYDLGGGAKVVGGYAKNQTTDQDAFDFGLSFSF
jgi:outer membrane protein OmpU